MLESWFTGSSSEVLLNPRIDKEFQEHVKGLVNSLEFKEHIFLATSGTTRGAEDAFKLVALSKKAILASAMAVNQQIDATHQDVWLKTLPEFHVGGLGILARSFLSASRVIHLEKWSAVEFLSLITNTKVTLTSLVEAQVYDLCLNELQAPKSLKKVIVGGGAINQQLYEKALLLGWPLVVSYGLTEMSSQVATSKLNSKELSFLSHVQGSITDDGFLRVKSDALLTANILITGNQIQVVDPKVDGWYVTEDLATLKDGFLKILGRAHDFIKIGGESVLFSNLEKKFQEIKLECKLKEDAAIIAFPDERLGFVVHLASVSNNISTLVEKFNNSVMPYERIRHTHFVSHIPRTALNKLCKKDLLTTII